MSAEHLPDQDWGATTTLLTILAGIVENSLRGMDVQEQAILGRSRSRGRVSGATGDVCGELLLSLCVIERRNIASNQGYHELASNEAPGRSCLRAYSGLTAVLHLCVSTIWCYRSSEPKIADWRLCVSDIREVVCLARLLQASAVGFCKLAHRLTLKLMARWIS